MCARRSGAGRGGLRHAVVLQSGHPLRDARCYLWLGRLRSLGRSFGRAGPGVWHDVGCLCGACCHGICHPCLIQHAHCAPLASSPAIQRLLN